jgi:outer membrane receptor protein involved in Fe transport
MQSKIHAPFKRHLLAVSILLAGVSLPVLAEEAAVEELPQLDVVGESTPEEHRIKDITPQVKNYKESVQQQPTGFVAKDILKRMPGMYTGGGPGEDKDARLRGIDKEYTRVSFDGVMLPDGGEKRELNIDRIPNALVGEVTIIRNTPAEFESDGLAGQVHIKTRDIPLEQQIEVDAALGDRGKLGTEAQHAAVTYGNRFTEQFGLQGTVAYYKNPLLKDKTKTNAAGVVTEIETEDKPTENSTAMLDAGWFYDGGELHLKPLFIEDTENKDKLVEKYKANGTFDKYENEIEDKTKTTEGVLLEQKHRFGGGAKLDANVGYYSTTEEKDKIKRTLNQQKVEDITKRELEVEDKEDSFWQAEAKMTQRWEAVVDNELKYGIKLRQRERTKEKTKYRNGVLIPGEAKDKYELEEDYYALFVQNEVFFTGKFSVMPGVRGEYVELISVDRRGAVADEYHADVMPSLATRYTFSKQFNVYAMVSEVINRPRYDELMPFADEKADKILIGNPDLEPAEAIAYDAGFNYVTEPFFFGFNLFYRDIEGVIESRLTGEEIDGKPVEQIQNVGDGWLKGVELEQRWNLSSLKLPVLDQIVLTANQSYIESELTNNDGSKTPFKEQPRVLANLIVDWTLPVTGTILSVAGNFVHSFPTTATSDGRDSETFIDAKLSQPVGAGITLYALAENVTGEDRVKHKMDGTLEEEYTGRYFYLGVNAKF